jgi:hypothetical protein
MGERTFVNLKDSEHSSERPEGLSQLRLSRNFHRMSDHDTYTIRETAKEWSLWCNGDRVAAFFTREEVEHAALAAADLSRRNGRMTEVLLQDARGNVEFLLKAEAGHSVDVRGSFHHSGSNQKSMPPPIRGSPGT